MEGKRGRRTEEKGMDEGGKGKGLKRAEIMQERHKGKQRKKEGRRCSVRREGIRRR